jgi:hypothetical protein
MNRIFSSSILLIFGLTACIKNECHEFIKVDNQSNKDVVLARQYVTSANPKCLLLETGTISKGSSFNFKPYVSNCIEHNLKVDSGYVDFVLVDAENFHEGKTYNCDSYGLNKVVATYSLSLKDLRKSDFHFVYK